MGHAKDMGENDNLGNEPHLPTLTHQGEGLQVSIPIIIPIIQAPKSMFHW